MIGTNKKDAADTVARIAEDLAAGRVHTPAITDAEEVGGWLATRNDNVVTWDGWTAIDAHERSLGELHGRPRVKLVRLRELYDRGRGVAR